MCERTALAPYLVQNTAQYTTLVYKTLHGDALDYMKSMLREHVPSRWGL